MMKKALLMVVGALLVISTSVSAHGNTGKNETAYSNAASVSSATPAALKGLSVLVNGVPVQSEANHIYEGKTYVSVQAFADLFHMPYSLSNDRQRVDINGMTIANVRIQQGVATALVRELADAVGAQQVSWDADRREVYVLALPQGSVMITGVVPAMGEHWSNPAVGELPIGPIYGVYNGRLVFLEYMIAQDDFISGKNHVNLNGMKGVPAPAVVQTDIEFQPTGHEGFELPHYDIHLYFVTEEEQQAIH